MCEESFKEIPGFPAYMISNKGIIKSKWRTGAFYSGYECEDRWKILPQYPDKKGYLQVHLCNGKDKPKTVRVHNIMALVFFGNKPEGLYCVRHLDGNPKNNNVENLAYGTYIENEMDKKRHGTFNKRNGGAKLSPEDVIKIKKSKKSQEKLAEEFRVSRPTITRIKNGTTWKESS